jgi:ATP-dependent Lhr-like helicase
MADPDSDPRTRAASAQIMGEVLLDRYGILTRGSVGAERLPRELGRGFSAVYRVLSAFEDAGRCRRGYFVEGLGAAQFAADGAIDRLRALAAERAEGGDASWGAAGEAGAANGSADADWSWDPRTPRTRREPPTALLLAAADPANAYGAAIPWPERPGSGGHKPGRKAGALVVLVDGELVLYVERGGRTVLSWSDSEERLAMAARAVATAVRDGRVGALTVASTDGVPVLTAGSGASPTPMAAAFVAAGFAASPQGLRLRA